jgi:hypothetical protein
MTRKVVANISLSFDGRVTGPGGDSDMGGSSRARSALGRGPTSSA